MASLNDEKLRYLEVQLLKTGHIRDLEREWLLSLLPGGPGTYPETLRDLWSAFFDFVAIPPGANNDRAFAYLFTQGHTQGTLSARWHAFWSS